MKNPLPVHLFVCKMIEVSYCARWVENITPVRIRIVQRHWVRNISDRSLRRHKRKIRRIARRLHNLDCDNPRYLRKIHRLVRKLIRHIWLTKVIQTALSIKIKLNQKWVIEKIACELMASQMRWVKCYVNQITNVQNQIQSEVSTTWIAYKLVASQVPPVLSAITLLLH